MDSSVVISNLPKLIVACLFLVCITVLMLAGRVASEVGVPAISSTTVYILTNGVRGVRQPTSTTTEPEA